MTVESGPLAGTKGGRRLSWRLAGIICAAAGGLAAISLRTWASGGGEPEPPPRPGGVLPTMREPDEAVWEEPSRWRRVLMALVALVVAGGLGFLAYQFWFGGGDGDETEFVTEAVGRATIRSSIATSGVAASMDQVDLRFSTAGRVQETLVEVGQEVKKDDPLIRLDDDSMKNRLATAEANLASAQIRLTQILKGASEAELAAAEQAVASAHASVGRAQRDLDELREGASEAELAAADQAVVSAQTARDKAQRDLQDLLDGASEADLAAAEQSVVSAQAARDKAQRDLQDLLEGASEAELATAEQAVVSAEAARDKAKRDLDELKAGASATELAAAEQAVAAAEAVLASAQATYDQLQAAPSDAEVAAAQSSVAAAEQALASAEAALQNAGLSEDLAQADLELAGSAYCLATPTDPAAICPPPLVIPLSDTEVADLLASVSVPGEPVTEILDLVAANAAYVAATSAVDTAEDAVDSAEAALDAAEEKLDAVLAGPDSLDLAAAKAAVDSAQEALDTANLQLSELRAGPDADQLAAAQDALDSAQASLDAAVAKRDELVAGATLDQIAAAEDALRSAQAGLDAAVAKRDDLVAGATLDQIATAEDALDSAQASLDAAVAKRDDLVAGADASDIAVAEDALLSAQASLQSATAKLADLLAGADSEDVQLQRQQIRLAELSVQAARDDLDEATLRAPFDGTVAAINVQPGDLVGSTLAALTLLTPGAMKVELAVGETDLPRISTGMTGVIIFDAIQGKPFPIVVSAIDLAPGVEQGIVTYSVDATLAGLDGAGPKPAPGMNGAAIVISEQRANVLAVPNRAIRRRGEDLVVDIMVDGAVEARVIKTGLSDDEMTEVLEGVEEGEMVVVGTKPKSGEGSESGARENLPEGVR